jgi:hypothetical protein
MECMIYIFEVYVLDSRVKVDDNGQRFMCSKALFLESISYIGSPLLPEW